MLCAEPLERSACGCPPTLHTNSGRCVGRGATEFTSLDLAKRRQFMATSLRSYTGVATAMTANNRPSCRQEQVECGAAGESQMCTDFCPVVAGVVPTLITGQRRARAAYSVWMRGRAQIGSNRSRAPFRRH